MTKWLIWASFVLFPCGLLGNEIDIQLVRAAKLVSDPGKVNSFSIQITNRKTTPTVLLPTIQLPDNWKIITNNGTLTLKSGEKKNKLISILIPPKTIAGQYEITYILVDKSDPSVSYQEKMVVEIRATNKLEVIPLEAPATALSTDKIKGKFLVKNHSNQKQNIQLITDNAVIKGESLIKLAPFTTKMVEVTMAKFEELRIETRVSFSLKGVIQGTNVATSAYLHTHMIPRLNYEVEDRRKLPGYVSLNYLSRQFSDGKKGAGFQGELFVQGAIDAAKKKEVTLSLRGPNRQDETELSLYDEYFASYSDNNWTTTIGDNTFKLSTLTEFSRNGRGIKTNYKTEEFEVGGFYLKPRFFPDLKKEIGIYVKKQFTRTNAFRFNFLQKDFLQKNKKATVLSIAGTITPFKNSTLETELASSNGGQAAFMNFQADLSKRFRVNANLIYASPNFEGYFNNSFNISANASYQLTKKVDLFVGIYQDDRNAALDTLLSAAPYSNRKNFGIRYRLDGTSSIQVGFRKNEIEDRLPTKQFFREENLLTAQLTKNFNRFLFSASSEYGQSQNFLQTTETDLQTIFRVFADAQLKISHFNLQAFGQYYNQNSLLLPQQKQVLWGGSISGEVRRNTQFRLRYQNDFAVEEYYKNRNSFDLFLAQRIQNNHLLTINAQQTLRRNTFGKKEFALSFKYTYNFGIPLEKSPPKGNVYGQIIRKDGSPAKGIIVLLNGKTAVTDEVGNFHFKRMNPGKYSLVIDKSTLKIHEITEKPFLPLVEVLPERDEHITIQLLQSGALYGAIEMESIMPKAQKIALQNIGNLMIEVKKGEEIRRTFTDEHGQYQFRDLRPGQWEVKVLTHQLDKNILVKKMAFKVNIGVGEKNFLPIPIRQKQRKVQFKKIITLSDDD